MTLNFKLFTLLVGNRSSWCLTVFGFIFFPYTTIGDLAFVLETFREI